MVKGVILGFIGLCGGALVAAGVFAFIIIIGAVTKLVSRTCTASYILGYEDVIVVGATVGNLMYVFDFGLPLGTVGLVVFGVFAGMFIGCLSASLAETLKVMPAFEKRIHLQKGIAYVICAFALGKLVGSVVGLLY